MPATTLFARTFMARTVNLLFRPLESDIKLIGRVMRSGSSVFYPALTRTADAAAVPRLASIRICEAHLALRAEPQRLSSKRLRSNVFSRSVPELEEALVEPCATPVAECGIGRIFRLIAGTIMN
jgi:hypothetical protein